jgi:hypothetical protein
MAHIKLPDGIPGIVGPMVSSPETAKPMNALAGCCCAGRTASPRATAR